MLSMERLCSVRGCQNVTGIADWYTHLALIDMQVGHIDHPILPNVTFDAINKTSVDHRRKLMGAWETDHSSVSY